MTNLSILLENFISMAYRPRLKRGCPSTAFPTLIAVFFLMEYLSLARTRPQTFPWWKVCKNQGWHRLLSTLVNSGTKLNSLRSDNV